MWLAEAWVTFEINKCFSLKRRVDHLGHMIKPGEP